MANPSSRSHPEIAIPGLTVLSDDGRIITGRMAVADWISVSNHPRQRDSERHARARHWTEARHAEGAVLDHLGHVKAALLDGVLYKIDGHTRALLWTRGELPSPTEVHVTVYRVSSRAELNALYGTVDAESAAEKQQDKIFGAYRESELVLTSTRLKSGMIGSALNIALRGFVRRNQPRDAKPIDVYRAVHLFRQELQTLDRLDPPNDLFQTGLIAAALLMLALEPRTEDFFRAVAAREGNMRGGRSDPVQAVIELVTPLLRSGRARNQLEQEDLCARSLRAAKIWLGGERSRDYWMLNKPRAENILDYCHKVKVSKGVSLDDPDL
ncbi:hypothetical protein [Methylocaldum szegediense]|uniref:hypothetical protein n=1 Tax=Methylocaldum szegediense TaxID=73780 RepID=UPI000416E40E|nr:hypothetical protein [Methylocaldum szegediense]